MAKGQITDDELAAGMKGLGGFGAIAPTSAPARRDSPFRDSRPGQSADAKTVDLKTVEQPAPQIVPVEKETSRQMPTDAVERSIKPKGKAPARKGDVYSEKVSLKMSPEMRDEIDELARQLQRSKMNKDERITANTVMRVAIRAVLDEFELGRGECANNEGELLTLVKNRLFKR